MSTQSNNLKSKIGGWFSKSDLEAKIEVARLAIPEASRPAKVTGWKSKSGLEAKLAEFQSLAPQACTSEPYKSAASLVNDWETCKADKQAAGNKTPVAACLAEQHGQTLGPDASKESLAARISILEAQLAAAKASPVPAAGARLVEQAARQTAQELSAERRGTASPPTKYASFPDNAVIAVIKDYMPNRDADKAVAAAEMTKRGYKVEGGRVTMSRAEFQKLDHAERGEKMSAGFSIRDDDRSADTPTAASSAAELTFPVGSQKTPRTPEQFLALSAAEVAKITELASKRREGIEIRQEVYDAWDSYSPISWRNDGKRNNNSREPFYQKYKELLAHCRAYGPRVATPNDPPPPVSPNAMTAADFIGLPTSVIEKMGTDMERYREHQRNQRAELKRAYVKATPAEKTSLFTLFKGALTAFPAELI